jgi:diaminobutyrate-2-oxoglutarate transaminase
MKEMVVAPQKNVFEERESNVRSYARVFNDVFDRAKGAVVYSESGTEYIDFFAGAGTLNYGHNNDYIKGKLIDYLTADGIVHSLDMNTVAKREFLETFYDTVLKPSKLDYKVQFCGSTGTNAVEAAFKLARKVTGRTGIFSFMGAYHGVSLGSLAATGNREKRRAAGLPLAEVTFLPFPHGFMATFDTIRYIEQILTDTHSGIDVPAAIVVETIQAEGGVIVATTEWLRRLRKLCDDFGILLICDDIQVGCGRTGPFFSFERAGVVPDLVTLSKSISGYGGPMSLLLMKPHLDVWSPGEHNGTFRGHQLSFVGAKAALELRRSCNLQREVEVREAFLKEFLEKEIVPLREGLRVRGTGMIWGIDFSGCGGAPIADAVASRCFELGLMIEKAGRDDTVIKILPPLIIEMDLLEKGCSIIQRAILEMR